jgi:DNA polymerase
LTILWLDLETYSPVPIRHGLHAYAQQAEILLLAWAIDDSPAQVVDMTLGVAAPAKLRKALASPSTVFIAHNSQFDRTLLRRCVPEYAGAPHRWQDTMVKALAHSLPGSLDVLCELLGVPQDKAKQKAGKELVRLFCLPRPKNAKIPRATRATHPEQWAQFIEYAKMDVEAMREVDKRLPHWNMNAAEVQHWHWDQLINDRGFAVDLDLVDAALAAIAQASGQLADATLAATGGVVPRATQRDALLDWIMAEYGISLPDLQKSTLERRLADPDLPDALRELLSIRLQAATTSTAKYKALKQSVSHDGRMRGTLQFCGASRTGRWAGRIFQPQNLPRPTLPAADIAAGIDALKGGYAGIIWDDVMGLTSNALRGCIMAPPGKKLIVADLANIEGRAQAWLAGEEWKLQAFRDYDAGQGEDLYKLAYARSFAIAPQAVTKDQRQIGKVMELALGYGGGVGAFATFAQAYGIDLDDLAERANIPADARAEAEKLYQWTLEQGRSALGLSKQAFIVCDALKRLWRNAHPQIVKQWDTLARAVREAIDAPGKRVPCHKCKIQRDGNWLRIGLPSGRALCYPQPRVTDSGITHMGMNPYSRKWERLKTWGGKLFENTCQAAARDVLAANMIAIDKDGYRIVLSVHDEWITETPDTSAFSVAGLVERMTRIPSWATGLPLAAAGCESYRYRKD